MSDNHNRIDVREFRESGLLHELNRQFLHPLGMALETVKEDDGTERFGGIWDYRNDPEGMLFATLDFDKIKDVAEFTRQQHERRRKTIGFVVQEESMP